MPNTKFQDRLDIASKLMKTNSVENAFGEIPENPSFFRRLLLFFGFNKKYRRGGGTINEAIGELNVHGIKSYSPSFDDLKETDIPIGYSTNNNIKNEFIEYVKCVLKAEKDIHFVAGAKSHMFSIVCKFPPHNSEGNPILIIEDSHGFSSKHKKMFVNMLSEAATQLDELTKANKKSEELKDEKTEALYKKIQALKDKKIDVLSSTKISQFDRYSCWFRATVATLQRAQQTYDDVKQLIKNNMLFKDQLPSTVYGIKAKITERKAQTSRKDAVDSEVQLQQQQQPSDNGQGLRQHIQPISTERRSSERLSSQTPPSQTYDKTP